ncbi:MAG: hypothetical protein A2W31_11515 [Planctomycetes bacterium RBG_16_64_10]|nr:MAG: hypothetical protein A2W31_11515 [Planctomycetes bacterium RBG_16_64_10]
MTMTPRNKAIQGMLTEAEEQRFRILVGRLGVNASRIIREIALSWMENFQTDESTCPVTIRLPMALYGRLHAAAAFSNDETTNLIRDGIECMVESIEEDGMMPVESARTAGPAGITQERNHV